MTLEKMIQVLKELDSASSIAKTLYITNECKIAELLGKLKEQDRIMKIISLYKNEILENDSLNIKKLFTRMIKDIELEYFANKQELDTIVKENK